MKPRDPIWGFYDKITEGNKAHTVTICYFYFNIIANNSTAFANSFFFTIEASREVRMIKNNYNCMFNEEKIVLPTFRVLPGAGKTGCSRRVFPGAGFSCQP